MISRKQLEEMEHMSGELSNDKLTDLLNITITGQTPDERFESYLSQIGNPYRFRVGKTPVRIYFQNNGNTLSEKLKTYFLSLKGGEFFETRNEV